MVFIINRAFIYSAIFQGGGGVDRRAKTLLFFRAGMSTFLNK